MKKFIKTEDGIFVALRYIVTITYKVSESSTRRFSLNRQCKDKNRVIEETEMIESTWTAVDVNGISHTIYKEESSRRDLEDVFEIGDECVRKKIGGVHECYRQHN